MTSHNKTLAILPGDGIGPEVIAEAEAVLEDACNHWEIPITSRQLPIGGAAVEADGVALSDAALDFCRNADAILVGAVGGPRWAHHRGASRPGAGLLRLRRELGLFANVRPVRVSPALAARSLLPPATVGGADLVIVRELTGGLYFGQPRYREGSGDDETAVDTLRYTRGEIERVVSHAFALAERRRGHLISVDKAGVLATGRLWRDVVEAARAAHPRVTVEHQLVDSFALRLLRAPRGIDVVVTENLFGDILSSEAAALPGSAGVLPSMSVGVRSPALYEPIHGSAPDIAGSGLANPVGAILSVALMLEHSLAAPTAAAAVREAVDMVSARGTLTPDSGGNASTSEVGTAVREALAHAVRACVPTPVHS